MTKKKPREKRVKERRSNLPYMKFYTSDFLMDVQTLSMEARGCWITMLCHIWHKSENGTVKLTNNQVANLWGLEEKKAIKIMLDLADTKIFDYSTYEDNFTIENVNIITSRRIARDKKGLLLNAIHQSKYKEKVMAESEQGKAEVRGQKSEVRSQYKNKDNRGVEIPEDLKTSEPEILDWLEYKKQKGQPYKPKGLEALWRAFRAIAPERRRAAVDTSMANNYAGLYLKETGMALSPEPPMRSLADL